MKHILNQEKIRLLTEQYNLKLLLLFGSQASGATHALSDYDFGYVSERTLDYAEQANLQSDLVQAVGFGNVEAINLSAAGPFLLREVIKNHQVVFAVEDSYERFYTYAVQTYMDEQRLFDLDQILYQQTLKKYQKQYAE